MSKVHICFLAPGTYPSLVKVPGVEVAGGAEIQQARLMRMLAADGYRVSLVSSDFGQGDPCDVDGIHVVTLPDSRRCGVKGLRWITPRLTDAYAALRHLAPDWVYVRTATAYLLPAAGYCRRSGARLIHASAHDFDFMPGRNPLLTWRDEALFRWGTLGVDVHLVQNARQADLLRRRRGRDGLVMPSLHIEPGAGRARFDGPILWVATIIPWKRPELLLELARRMPDRRFVMIGGMGAAADARTYHGQIADQASRLPNLSFVGFVPPSEIGHHFDDSALLVNTSVAEGFPNTFLQAWIRGMPSVSFVQPRTAEEPSVNLACADLDAMHEMIGRLLSDEARWAAIGTNCRDHVQARHSVQALIPRYRQLLDTPRTR